MIRCQHSVTINTTFQCSLPVNDGRVEKLRLHENKQSLDPSRWLEHDRVSTWRWIEKRNLDTFHFTLSTICCFSFLNQNSVSHVKTVDQLFIIFVSHVFPVFFFSFFSLSTTVMVNWWFGARLFGSLGSPKMKGVVNEGHPDSNPKPPGPKPPNVPSRKLTYPTKRERKIAQKCEKDVSVFCKSFAGFKF